MTTANDPGSAPVPPSGEQWEIAEGGHSAVVVELGGGLRRYDCDGVHVVDGYDVDAMPSGGRGQVLAPWPNRIGNGRYRFDGEDHQLPINETAAHNAIHGLTRWVPWRALSRRPSEVTVSHRLLPQPGYPWALQLTVTWGVGPGGLRADCEAVNLGSKPAPWGFGVHPYLTVGTFMLDDAVLTVDAATSYVTDDRQLPAGRRKVPGTDMDYSGGRMIGGAVLDECYTDLQRDGHGDAGAVLADPATGAQARLWCDQAFGYLMVFTGDTLAPEQRRRALAVEPMTCAPDAFRTGDGLLTLAPGGSWRGSWGIAANLGHKSPVRS